MRAHALADGNGRAGLENLFDLWVHVDEQAAFLLDLVVPLLHNAVHPLLEWIVDQGVADVGHVATQQLLDLTRLQCQSLCDCWVVLRELEHVLRRQAFELWHIDVLDVLRLDDPPFAGADVLEVEDRHGRVAAQVDADLARQKPEDLVLTPVLSAELLSCDVVGHLYVKL